MPATATPGDKLTLRQEQVLTFIRSYWRDHGRSPTIRDLGEFIGSPHPNAAVGYLRLLAAKGMIEWSHDGTARGIWPAGLRAAIAEAVDGDHTEVSP